MSNFTNIYKTDMAKEFSPDASDRTHFASILELLAQRVVSDAQFSDGELTSIQANFHELMRYRCRGVEQCLAWLSEHEDELPKISNDLLGAKEPEWFPIPGMYGGFSYGLFERDGKPVLVADSWVRIVGGSGEQHEITADKVELVARGFV
jgi:hypothetical protein